MVRQGPKQVRQSLVYATLELLETEPMTSITTKAIAARAGVNHGQVHHYFGSKTDLISAAAAARFAEGSGGPRRVPIPTETVHRSTIWRALAHLAAAGAWRDANAAPEVTGAGRRSAEVGATPESTDVVAEVLVGWALQLGWWLTEDLVVELFLPPGGSPTELRAAVAARSSRVLDTSFDRPAFEVTAPHHPLRDLRRRAAIPEGGSVRDRLELAVLSLLGERPVSELTSREIAAEAQVNRGQIHHYFGSTDTMLASAIARGLAMHVEGRLTMGTVLALPVDIDRPGYFARAVAHVVAVDKVGHLAEVSRGYPVWRRAVEDAAGDRDPDGIDVAGELAALFALELGWDAYRPLLMNVFDHERTDVDAVLDRCVVVAARLTDR